MRGSKLLSSIVLVLFAQILNNFIQAEEACNGRNDQTPQFNCSGFDFKTFGCYSKYPNTTVYSETLGNCLFYNSTNCNFTLYAFYHYETEFNITLNSTNVICIDHFKSIRSLPIYTVTNVSQDSRSIRVILNLGTGMGWEDNRYDFGYFCRECSVNRYIFPNKKDILIEGLPYADYNYTFDFELRFKGSQYHRNLPFYFSTAPRKPDLAPSQKHFMFRVENKNLILYWKNCEPKYRNGPNFYVSLNNETGIIKMDPETSNYTLSLPEKRTTYYLKNCNDLGCSEESAALDYHPRNDTYKLRVWSTKISRILWIKWWFPSTIKPTEIKIVSDYEVIQDKVENANLLKVQTDSLNPKLGIIAIFEDYSTGVVLSECDPREFEQDNISLARLNSVFPVPGVDSIKVEFTKTECWHNVVVDHCILKVGDQNKTTNLLAQNVTFKGLEPLKAYNLTLEVHMDNLSRSVVFAEEVFTLENIKDSPKNLTVVNKTSDSVTLSWQPSQQVNASNIRSYYVYVKGDKELKEVESYGTNQTIEKLEPDTTYQFQVAARYVKEIEESSRSESISVTTNKPRKPEVASFPPTAIYILVGLLLLILFLIGIIILYKRLKECWNIYPLPPAELNEISYKKYLKEEYKETQS